MYKIIWFLFVIARLSFLNELDFYASVWLIAGYVVLIPSGVGGGSLVIGGFIDEPSDDYYNYFPEEITKEEMNRWDKIISSENKYMVWKWTGYGRDKN
jgi:hypothetical protein